MVLEQDEKREPRFYRLKNLSEAVTPNHVADRLGAVGGQSLRNHPEVTSSPSPHRRGLGNTVVVKHPTTSSFSFPNPYRTGVPREATILAI